MSKLKLLFAIMCLCLLASGETIAVTGDLLAEWNFDEGQGDVSRDVTGNGHDARFHGATWAKRGNGFAVSLDGIAGFVDCGKLPIKGPITIEAWIKPMRKGRGTALLLGEDMHSYLVAYDNAESCYWYLGDGSNHQRVKLDLGEWNQITATFDGKTFSLWHNGRLEASEQSKIKDYKTLGRFVIGIDGPPQYPRFKGLLDQVRVYDRALPGEEIVTHFKSEAPDYGFDPVWFSRVKATPYYYFDRGELVVEANFRGLQPLGDKPRIEVTLSNKQKPQEILQRQVIDPLPDGGLAEATLASNKLVNGDYVIRVALHDGKESRPVEELVFSYPPKLPSVPAPSAKIAAPLPPPPTPTPFGIEVGKGGGFQLTIKGTRYPFESRVSWPNGEFNRLTAKDAPDDKGEKSWKVNVQATGKDSFQVEAAGGFYTIRREIKVFPTHVSVKDTYTNTTKEDWGLLIYNEATIKPGQVTGSWLSGYEERGRRVESSDPDWGPNVFFTDANTGIGIIPIDDVYVLQALPYVLDEAAGVTTEKFALGPGKSYTLEWAVYPAGSGDYYDFINNFRKVEGRISTIEGAPGFITWGPKNRHQVPDPNFMDRRGIKIGIVHCLSGAEDDPEVSIEGCEFLDFPREIEAGRRQAALFHRKYPGRKIVFHIAHSEYGSTNADRFADSKVILDNGKQALWGPSDVYISPRRQKEGWLWWIYYPTPGNSFHDMMMKSVDVMMDDMGMDGAFMDGFFAAYMGRWSYDTDVRWDGHSAEIDPATKTIKRKMNSVLLLSQPSLIEFARKIRDKGGVVIAENDVITRSIANEKYLIFDYECASGPQLHLAPSLTALAMPPFKSEKELYLDALDKLSWGELFVYYNERINLTYPSLPAREFPMTFEEIRSGLVRGKSRIVTMNSGVYGWPGDRSLHAVYKFDDRGAPAVNDFVTTIDTAGVRTELAFHKHESAVIEPIPVSLEANIPVNVRVQHYDADTLKLSANGQGEAMLSMFVGTSYPDKRYGVFQGKDGGFNPATAGIGDAYRVTVGGATTTIKEKDGTLFVPLKLSGQVDVTIEQAK